MTDENITLNINGQIVSVKKGTTVYEAANQVRAEIPIFCYQDRMPPFGACRVCLVEVENMPKLQTSCTLVATEGMNVKTESARAVDGRKGILELLLINHPLDCPVCDKGGECPLQENALQHGPGKSEFFEEKRKFTKPLPLGPVLMLDRERCIICSRCTRFGDLIAGDHALEMIDRGYKTEVGTKNHEPIDSKFIGNTIQICPVGALTSQVYRFRARPWDNTPSYSSCTLCPVGCSMIFDSRDGDIMRTRSQENKAVNDIWLCDKGFFGYQFTSDARRIFKPLIRKNGKLEESTMDEALSLVANKLLEAKTGGKIAAFGGNPLTTEENYLFQQLMRQGLNVNNLDHKIGTNCFGLGMEIGISDCENLSYAYLLGADITEEFPVIWLRLRQAINKGAKVIFFGHYKPEIADYMSDIILHAPGNELETLSKITSKEGKGAIFVGSQYLNSKNAAAILSELTKIKQKNANLSVNILEGSGNSMGACIAGMNSDFGPLFNKSATPGLNALGVLKEARDTGFDVLYVAGANPAAKFSKKLFEEARSKLKFLVVQDIFLNETALLADIVLPSLCYVEKGGSFINVERRIQKLQPGKELPDGLYSDGEIFTALASKMNMTLTMDSDFFRILNTDRVDMPLKVFQEQKNEISKRQNGTLLATFSKRLFDHGVRMQHNEHLVKLVKKANFRINKDDGLKFNLYDGDQVIVSAGENSVNGAVMFDEGVAEGTIVLPLGFPEVPVYDLNDELFNGLEVTIKKVYSNL